MRTRCAHEGKRMMQNVLLTPPERALLRLLVAGRSLEESAVALGIPQTEVETQLEDLKRRCGVPNFNRLVVLAYLNSWV